MAGLSEADAARAPLARGDPPKTYPAGGKLTNEFGSRPPRALAVLADQENPYSEGISPSVCLRRRGARRRGRRTLIQRGES